MNIFQSLGFWVAYFIESFMPVIMIFLFFILPCLIIYFLIKIMDSKKPQLSGKFHFLLLPILSELIYFLTAMTFGADISANSLNNEYEQSMFLYGLVFGMVIMPLSVFTTIIWVVILLKKLSPSQP